MTWPQVVALIGGIAFGGPSAAFCFAAFMSACEGRDPWPWRSNRGDKP